MKPRMSRRRMKMREERSACAARTKFDVVVVVLMMMVLVENWTMEETGRISREDPTRTVRNVDRRIRWCNLNRVWLLMVKWGEEAFLSNRTNRLHPWTWRSALPLFHSSLNFHNPIRSESRDRTRNDWPAMLKTFTRTLFPAVASLS